VPTLKDRVMQCLVKLALEPEWEAVFEPNSFGFRPGRSVQDAAVAVKYGLGAQGVDGRDRRVRCRWVLDADIKSFFDEIDHDAILCRVPVFRRVIAGWLKAGVFTGEVYSPTDTGTPQGGVISPLLANIAWHGLEDLFHEWSFVGGRQYLCETVETFPEPPAGYRKCKPVSAKASLRGPVRPRTTDRRLPPKVYGPYPDGSWRTLRLVVNDVSIGQEVGQNIGQDRGRELLPDEGDLQPPRMCDDWSRTGWGNQRFEFVAGFGELARWAR
jgi:hypothetical protein